MRPGDVLVGLGFLAMMSMNHCMPISSAHMSAEAVSTPGMHVQPLVPSRSTVSVPSAPISTTFAPSRIAGGPDFSARAMRYSVMTSDMSGSFAGGAWLCAVYQGYGAPFKAANGSLAFAGL